MPSEDARDRAKAEGVSLLRELARQVSDLIRPTLPDGVAFLVVLADVGPAGSMVYAANVARPEAIELLAELRSKMIEGGN